MTSRAILKLIRDSDPRSVEALMALGVNVEYIAEGSFRTAYRILGTDLVIKLPIPEIKEFKDGTTGSDFSVGIAHTRAEARKIKRLSKTVLREHVPKVYYVNNRFGVIVMKYYPPIDKGRQWDEGGYLGEMLRKLSQKYLHIRLNDLGGDNLRQGKHHGIMIDLGY